MSEGEVRRRILAFVQDHPAVHVREVERQLHLSNRLASYHLRELQRGREVRRVREAGYARYFGRDALAALTKRDVAFLCFMRRPAALKITVALLDAGESTQGDLAKDLRLAKASTTYHLNALRNAGFLLVRHAGRERWYSLTDPTYARERLARFEPTPGSLDRFSSMWDALFG